MNRIQFTLCGNLGPDDALNPYLVCEPPARQEILRLINAHPWAPDALAAETGQPEEEIRDDLAALERAGLVEQVGPAYRPTFAIFTAQDQERLQPFVADAAAAFAAVVRAHIGTVRHAHDLCRFAAHGYTLADTAYILVGAYTLDYGGITLRDAGLLVAAQEMPGGSYVFTGFEGDAPRLRESWMWGHAGRFGRFTFFGHGELPETGLRHAFPERAWRWAREGRPPDEIAQTMEEIGDILVALYRGPQTTPQLSEQCQVEPDRMAAHLALLRELGYVAQETSWRSRCPVVDEPARAEIGAMVQRVWRDLLDEAVRPAWAELERLYATTSPARHKVDLRVACNPIHHLIFEQALRQLMEEETLAWPPRRPDRARYAVWVERHGTHP